MFLKARPVFAKGKERELNYTLLLRAATDSLRHTVLYITASSFYRLFVNGKFVAFGPARTAGGYARVDEIALDKYDLATGNELVIEVAGYASHGLSTVQQDSFAVAELRRKEQVLLCTGRDFTGYRSAHRVQKAERYSAQRHFGEVYDFTEKQPFSDAYRTELAESKNPPVFLPRVVPYPTYRSARATSYSSAGRFRYCEPSEFRPNRYSFCIEKEGGRYAEEEIVTHPYRWIQHQKMTHERCGNLPVSLSAGEYVLVDMKKIEVGFFTWRAEIKEECELVLGFSELCSPRKFAFTNMNVQNVIEYRLPVGEIRTQSFEPYAARFVVLMVKKGSLKLRSFAIRTFEHDRARIRPVKVKDPVLRRIRAAAETTFVHNALDIYTDCPSRERAGWLCDSFFTGRAEYFLTGESRVEDAFLENYRLYRYTGELPRGALPMCYPADITQNGKWIPQWNMWYVLEVCEYLQQRRPDLPRELFLESVTGILDMLAAYENAEGLLQELPSWNFVEWSTANEWVQHVNYPTNFLYAEVLRRAGETFARADWADQSNKVRATTRERAFDGEVFVDNAVKNEEGVLCNTHNVSEAGQYYALLFGDLDLSDPKYGILMQHVRSSFATFEKKGREFVPVNAFIGLYLRVWLLMELGERELLAHDLKAFFGGMVKATGTLWEYKQHKGSYDHGFASFAALAIDKVENKG